MVTIEQIRQRVESEFKQFEQAFDLAMQTDNELLQNVFSLLRARRGKQLRPLLVLLSAKACREITQKTIQTAVAVELMHTASLIHDDVVDNSPTRRGLASVQAQFSNKVAVLTGDYLISKVFTMAAELRNVQILAAMSEVGIALTSGELLQLHTEKGMWITEKEYFQIIDKKTAQLFATCCKTGALSAGATARQLSALTLYGEQLGICFQMQDDILDYSDSDELGKPTMHDIHDGKATLPLIIALQRAIPTERFAIQALAEKLARGEMSQQEAFEAEQEIKSFVMRYDGIRYAAQRMEEHRQIALEALACLQNDEYKQTLTDLLDYTVCRIY